MLNLRRCLPLLLVAVVVLPACGSDDDEAENEIVQLDASTLGATVSPGERIELVIGEVNSSIGDDWVLSNVVPDGGVEIVDERYENAPTDPAPGASEGILVWTLEVGARQEPGSTITFDADNCYRGVCPDFEDAGMESERRSYSLTVEE